MKFQYNDGGRKAAGYKKMTGDCVVRAIAIASGKPYQEVYDELGLMAQRERVTKKMARRSHPEKGVYRKTYHKYLLAIGFKWVACMHIGAGCQVHLREGQLPMGRLVTRLSRHLAAVIDGTIHDLSNPSRDESRCVYGYYIKL